MRMLRTDVVLSQFQSWHIGAERVWRRSGTAKVFDLTDRDRPFQLQATVNQLLWNDVIGVCRIAP